MRGMFLFTLIWSSPSVVTLNGRKSRSHVTTETTATPSMLLQVWTAVSTPELSKDLEEMKTHQVSSSQSLSVQRSQNYAMLTFDSFLSKYSCFERVSNIDLFTFTMNQQNIIYSNFEELTENKK